jgi:hypothetical protein
LFDAFGDCGVVAEHVTDLVMHDLLGVIRQFGFVEQTSAALIATSPDCLRRRRAPP